ncbi:MAG: GNAT family N-acetyltransferase [Phycisphaeraceae bacterium]
MPVSNASTIPDRRPSLDTKRLLLRPFLLSDAERVRTLAGERAVADTTVNIPHPYKPGMAEQWIATHVPQFAEGKLVCFAITLRDSADLIGAVGLTITPRDHHAELGYWIGKPFWNQGYATEAGQAVIAHGFNTLGLHRIFATHLTRNPASGRVMQKLGMIREGVMRQHVRKWDELENVAIYGILCHEWPAV